MVDDIKIFRNSQAIKTFLIFFKGWKTKKQASVEFDPTYRDKFTRHGNQIIYHPTVMRYFNIFRKLNYIDEKYVRENRVRLRSGRRQRYTQRVRSYRVNFKMFFDYMKSRGSKLNRTGIKWLSEIFAHEFLRKFLLELVKEHGNDIFQAFEKLTEYMLMVNFIIDNLDVIPLEKIGSYLNQMRFNERYPYFYHYLNTIFIPNLNDVPDLDDFPDCGHNFGFHCGTVLTVAYQLRDAMMSFLNSNPYRTFVLSLFRKSLVDESLKDILKGWDEMVITAESSKS